MERVEDNRSHTGGADDAGGLSKIGDGGEIVELEPGDEAVARGLGGERSETIARLLVARDIVDVGGSAGRAKLRANRQRGFEFIARSRAVEREDLDIAEANPILVEGGA